MAFGYNFARLTSREALVDALCIDVAMFEKVLAFVPPPPAVTRQEPDPPEKISALEAPLFFRHDIPKKNKTRGHRTVWEPALPKPIYKGLARRLDAFFRLLLPGYPHERAFG